MSGCNLPADCIRCKFPQTIKYSLSPGNWARLQRYAYWMHRLHLGYDGKIPAGTLLYNSPGGVLCAKLEWLRWSVQETSDALPFFGLFFSPHLKRIALYNPNAFGLPTAQLTDLVQIISVLSTSFEGLLPPRTFIRGSYSPHHTASKFTLLDHHPGTPSDRSVVHFSIHRGTPPPRTSGSILASSFRFT